MTKSPGTVLALGIDATGVQRLRSAFGSRLRIFASRGDFLRAARDDGVELVIIPWRDTGDPSLATTVSAIRASRRNPPVQVFVERSAECLHALVSLGRAGASGVIVQDIDDDILSLRRLVERRGLSRALDVVRTAIARVVAERHQPLLLVCLERIGHDDPPAATAVATSLQVGRRTLSAWARQVGAKGVRPLVSQCRVLVAIELLRESGRALEHVAHALQFASSAHLHNTVRRYTGLTPHAALNRDAVEWCRVFFASTRIDAHVHIARKQVGLPGNGGIGLTTAPSPHVRGHLSQELTQ